MIESITLSQGDDVGKNLIYVLCLLPLFVFGQVTTKLVPVDHIYVPSGFDDNDSSEIVITGYLPNSCYKAPKSQYIVQGNTIFVTISAMHISGIVCLDVIVPFAETVRMGALKSQKYNILVNKDSDSKLTSTIAVERAASSNIDNFQYVYVANVRHAPGSKTIQIDGYSVSDCFALDEIRFISNGVDSYAVLPIMKQISSACPRKMTPVSYEAVLPTTIKRSEILLHVRSMQGNAVNSIYYSGNKSRDL